MSRKGSSTRISTERARSGPGASAPGSATATTSDRGPIPSRPFLVPVAALRRTAGASRHEVRRGLIEDLGAVSAAVPAGEPVVVDVALTSYPGGITARGTVSTRWAAECRRCSGAVGSELTAEVRERFTPEGGTDRDEDAYPLAGDELDLEPMARDAVLLELPLAPLCSPDCRGLCPQCGTNRNLGACDCVPARDPRWSALDALRGTAEDGLA